MQAQLAEMQANLTALQSLPDVQAPRLAAVRATANAVSPGPGDATMDDLMDAFGFGTDSNVEDNAAEAPSGGEEEQQEEIYSSLPELWAHQAALRPSGSGRLYKQCSSASTACSSASNG